MEPAIGIEPMDKGFADLSRGRIPTDTKAYGALGSTPWSDRISLSIPPSMQVLLTFSLTLWAAAENASEPPRANF